MSLHFGPICYPCNIKIKIYRIVILPVVSHGCEMTTIFSYFGNHYIHQLTLALFHTSCIVILKTMTVNFGLMFSKVIFSFSSHHHLPPWIRTFDLFWHRHIAIVSWGVHDLFFLKVCSWGRVSGVWCCPFFWDGWPSFVCIWVSRLVFQRSLILFSWLRFLFCPVFCIP